MKKILVILVGLILFCLSSANAKTVTLSWDPSPTPTVVGYRVYYDKNPNVPLDGSGAYQGLSGFDVGNTLTATVSNLEDWDTHYFAVTAYDASNESVYSNIVSSPPVRENDSDINDYYTLGTNVFYTDGVIKSDSTTTDELQYKKWLGTVSEGQLACISGNFYFSDGSHSDTIREESAERLTLRDEFTGELLGKEKYLFVDDSYKGMMECIFVEKVSSNAEFVVRYNKIGEHQSQVSAIKVITPETKPVAKFYVKKIAPKNGTGVFNLIFGFQEPIPSPEKYVIRKSKTLEGALTGEGDDVIESEVLNMGQNEYAFEYPADWQNDGMFASIQAVYASGASSARNITGFLPGNVLGTVDDLTPYSDISVSATDVYKVRAYALYNTSVVTGEYPATDIARSDLNPDGVITSYDYTLDIGYYRNYGHLDIALDW